MGSILESQEYHSIFSSYVIWGSSQGVKRQEGLNPSKIETVKANLTQIVPSQNIIAHMQTKN